MSKKPFFSVILTVYKNFMFIEHSLKSIINQSFKNFEIIIVDTYFNKDRKKLIYQQFKKNKNKINYVNFDNKKKAAGARNYGALIAKGNYLLFLDDDDLWKKKYLETLKKLLKKNNYDLIVTEFTEFYNSRIIKKNNLPLKFNINDVYVYNPGILPSNTAIKKATFIKLKGYNTILPNSSDKIILIDIIKKNLSYFVLKKNLVLRRIHKNQWSNNYYNMLKNNIKFYNYYKSYFIFIVKIRFLIKFLTTYKKFLTK